MKKKSCYGGGVFGCFPFLFRKVNNFPHKLYCITRGDDSIWISEKSVRVVKGEGGQEQKEVWKRIDKIPCELLAGNQITVNGNLIEIQKIDKSLDMRETNFLQIKNWLQKLIPKELILFAINPKSDLTLKLGFTPSNNFNNKNQVKIAPSFFKKFLPSFTQKLNDILNNHNTTGDRVAAYFYQSKKTINAIEIKEKGQEPVPEEQENNLEALTTFKENNSNEKITTLPCRKQNFLGPEDADVSQRSCICMISKEDKGVKGDKRCDSKEGKNSDAIVTARGVFYDDHEDDHESNKKDDEKIVFENSFLTYSKANLPNIKIECKESNITLSISNKDNTTKDNIMSLQNRLLSLFREFFPDAICFSEITSKLDNDELVWKITLSSREKELKISSDFLNVFLPSFVNKLTVLFENIIKQQNIIEQQKIEAYFCIQGAEIVATEITGTEEIITENIPKAHREKFNKLALSNYFGRMNGRPYSDGGSFEPIKLLNNENKSQSEKESKNEHEKYKDKSLADSCKNQVPEKLFTTSSSTNSINIFFNKKNSESDGSTASNSSSTVSNSNLTTFTENNKRQESQSSLGESSTSISSIK